MYEKKQFTLLVWIVTQTIFLSRTGSGAVGRGLGPPILVPDRVNSYRDVRTVVRQLRSLATSNVLDHRSSKLDERMLAFAYFLGVMVGDMGKYPKRRREYETMRVGLQLSKAHESNLRLGNYVVGCAALLGIRMKRVGDYIRPENRPYNAYRWRSQSSELLMWMFRACLGMDFDKVTTEVPVSADWLNFAPRAFQKSFVQGVADSDGYVDVNKHEVGIVADPNEFLIGRILERLKIPFRPAIGKGQATVVMNVMHAHSLPIFNPVVRSYRFELAERLSNATRLQGPWPGWLRGEVDRLLSSGASPKEIILTILNRYGVAIRSQHIRRRCYAPRNN